MTKKQLKEALSSMTKSQLTDLILELYGIKDVKQCLEGRFMDKDAFEEREKSAFKKACEGIYKAFHPRTHIARGCVSKSTKAINEFKKISKNKDMLAELLVYQIELISEFSGLIEAELYYNSMANTTDRNVNFLIKNGYIDKYLSRLRRIMPHIEEEYDLIG